MEQAGIRFPCMVRITNQFNMKQLFSIASPIYRQAIEHQECYMNIDGITPVDGFMVASGPIKRAAIFDFDPACVDSFIRANLDRLFNRRIYIHAWIEGDYVLLQGSQRMNNKRAAVVFGQDCVTPVYDVLNRKQLEAV